MFLSKRVPEFSRVLLVESGSRQLFETFLGGLYDSHPGVRADLVTCYAGPPDHFRQECGEVFNVNGYREAAARRKLAADLSANSYSVAVIICSGEPIMTKWKWVIAARVPAKLLVLNENGDYFFADRGNLAIIRHFMLVRAGLTDGGAVRVIGRLLMFPFTLLYLALYALLAHLRRRSASAFK
jgi:hypothetical protein